MHAAQWTALTMYAIYAATVRRHRVPEIRRVYQLFCLFLPVLLICPRLRRPCRVADLWTSHGFENRCRRRQLTEERSTETRREGFLRLTRWDSGRWIGGSGADTFRNEPGKAMATMNEEATMRRKARGERIEGKWYGAVCRQTTRC